jgi:hypothetical protein
MVMAGAEIVRRPQLLPLHAFLLKRRNSELENSKRPTT